MIGTRQRIDYRSGKAAIIRRTAMSYDRLMQVVAEQAMQRAMVQINRSRRACRASGAIAYSTAPIRKPERSDAQPPRTFARPAKRSDVG
jgi:hypothetical protein